MPQGLPKKIEVALLLADLALELGDPTPRRRSFIEEGAGHPRWVQGALARPTRPAQPPHPTLPHQVLPLVQTPAIDLQIRRHLRHSLAGRHPAHRGPLELSRLVYWSLHQFLSSRETVWGFSVSLSGCTSVVFALACGSMSTREGGAPGVGAD